MALMHLSGCRGLAPYSTALFTPPPHLPLRQCVSHTHAWQLHVDARSPSPNAVQLPVCLSCRRHRAQEHGQRHAVDCGARAPQDAAPLRQRRRRGGARAAPAAARGDSAPDRLRRQTPRQAGLWRRGSAAGAPSEWPSWSCSACQKWDAVSYSARQTGPTESCWSQ
jgi:hypothetical protein